MKTQNLALATIVTNYTLACQAEHGRITKDAVARAKTACGRANDALVILNRNRTEGTRAVWQETSMKAKNAVKAVKGVDFDEYMKLKRTYATILG